MRILIVSIMLLIPLTFLVSVESNAADFIKFGIVHEDDPEELWPDALSFISASGHSQITSVLSTNSNWNDGLDGDFGSFDAIVISEIIEGDSLSNETYARINDYVQNGGCLILTGDHGDTEDEFLNGAFGYSVTIASDDRIGETSNIQSGANGTAFAGGPADLLNPDLTSSFGNTPGDTIYTTINDEVVVFTDSFGAGTVTAIGWDYCCVADGETQQDLEEWYELINRALAECGLSEPSGPLVIIPTLSQWGMILTTIILGIFAVIVIRRKSSYTS